MSAYRQCTMTILDTLDDPNMQFDENGVCHYATDYFERVAREMGPLEKRTAELKAKIEQMKKDGQNKPYDCILGLSGGTDSSFMALWAHEQNLRPLVVHLDNGWNSELAVKNIENICSRLGFELHTHVIDWREFRDLQLAYLKASVVDIEVLTDHAIQAVILDLAAKYKIKYSLSGYNLVTEAIMPKGWTYDKRDFLNIKDIVKQYGGITRFKTFPTLTFSKKLYYHWIVNLESVYVLNYLDYNKDKAKQRLIDELGWRDYGGKHYESVFTKFYQAYILPQKFGIDKRKAHLSNLICSGQITREEALREMEQPLYDPYELAEEKEYVLKKFGLSEVEFDNIMATPPRNHQEFDSDERLWKRYYKIAGLKRAFSRK
ncbi:MAG: N-acetyl sugar amidotransferase [Flavobacteriales bacterium]|nr:N-acetyl sugar amidotransferase [Flavobacteriales bacterium]